MRQQRVSARERREAILKAVKCLFAEKGCEGVTTRELAQAAGVSEALLYLHFPSKESLYAAMAESCVLGPDAEEYNRILNLEPSASTLVALTHFLMKKKIVGSTAEKRSLDKLIVRSLLSDGDFMRTIHKQLGAKWQGKFRESLKAAVEAGEAVEVITSGELSAWLATSVGSGIMMYLLPSEPVIDTKLSRPEMVERAVWFVLLGVGVKAETIRKYYNPKALELVGGV